MLIPTKALLGFRLSGWDGDIGRCKDFLFDDDKWTIRYMVADTGTWLSKQKVLVSPLSLGSPQLPTRRIDVHLTRQQVEEAPPLDEHAPVSRQFEKQYARYYGYPPYWRGPSLWGVTEFPRPLYEKVLKDAEALEHPQGDPHLRSVKEVLGYHIRSEDAEFGHVEDFIMDTEDWKIQYVVIDTRNWLPSPSVVVPAEWIQSVCWSDSTVILPFSKEQIRHAPQYDADTAIDRLYETHLYDYYGRPPYWHGE